MSAHSLKTAQIGISRPGAPTGAATGRKRAPAARGFADLLASALRTPGLRLSAHAQARIEGRGLTLGAEQSRRLEAAVESAAAKGARQALVMLDRIALIVNIPSRTVITAIESDGARGTVFTNIDSAVIAQGGDAPTE